MMKKKSDRKINCRDKLDHLLTFINGDIKNMSDDEFYNLIPEYIHFAMQDDVPKPWSDFTKRHYDYVNKMLSDSNSKNIDKMKKFFSAIQSHLRARIEIIDYSFNEEKPVDLWENKIDRKLIYDPDTERFIPYINLEPKKVADELDLDFERHQADVRLEDIVIGLGMTHKSTRLRICKKCNKIFYQETKRIKLFCIKKCAKIFTQTEYIKRKKREA